MTFYIANFEACLFYYLARQVCLALLPPAPCRHDCCHAMPLQQTACPLVNPPPAGAHRAVPMYDVLHRACFRFRIHAARVLQTCPPSTQHPCAGRLHQQHLGGGPGRRLVCGRAHRPAVHLVSCLGCWGARCWAPSCSQAVHPSCCATSHCCRHSITPSCSSLYYATITLGTVGYGDLHAYRCTLGGGCPGWGGGRDWECVLPRRCPSPCPPPADHLPIQHFSIAAQWRPGSQWPSSSSTCSCLHVSCNPGG